MKKRQVQLIIASMAFALLGVIAFQLYWINDAIAVKNEQFTQQVQDALQAVVMKLERQEALETVKKKLKAQENAAPVIQTSTRQENSTNSHQPSQTKAYTAQRTTKKPASKENTVIAHTGNRMDRNQVQIADENNITFSWSSDNAIEVDGNNSISIQPFMPQLDELIVNSMALDTLTRHIHNEILQTAIDIQLPDMDMVMLMPDTNPDEPQPDDQANAVKTKKRAKQTKKPKQTQTICTLSHAHTLCQLEDLHIDKVPATARFNEKQLRLMLQQRLGESAWNFGLSQSAFNELNFRHDSLQHTFSWQAVPGVNFIIARKPQKRKQKTTTATTYTSNPFADSASQVKDNLKKNFEKVQHKSEIVGDVFRELVSKERPVTDRVTQKTLDSLLAIEIKNRRINIPYHFGVLSGQKSDIVLASTGTKAMHLPENVYKATLFPTDVFSTNDKLFVYFPTQQEFIMGKMWTVFSGSGLLILVILCCFYFAIATILKQKKLSDVKNDFINNMTHEFKTPISTISLACEVLQDEQVSKNPSQMNRYLHIIRDENKRLGQQVEKVLQAAMLDRGEVKLKITEVNIHEVIDHVLQNIGVQIEKRAGTVELHLEAGQTQIEADEVHLTNIIHNLLDNANKYSPEAPQITICTRSLPEGVSIRIADKGIGMSKDALTRIFDRFYRIPTGNVHNVKGFGLGLSYVKTILHGHHGRIHVESQLNIGSTFEIFLPYKQPC